ncbi:XK-related protein 8 [Hemicordylus capensis]|uniref:XK-related protein 8 n=1 Tax=Hemicordylus capensis TaxID=884348 RepID=UPI002302044D|nr:XK-related protein 8 [Hemicordylus capensis]
MAWSGCAPLGCSPRYRYLDLFFTLVGTIAFLADIGADVWMAVSYIQAGHYHWGGLVLGLLVVSSLTTQLFSWAWYQSDPKELRQALPTNQALLALHVLQLGYLYRCHHALKVGYHVCRMQAAPEAQKSYAIFLSHDISLLRLFETFLESAPQLTLLLYVMLCTNKAQPFQLLGIGTSFLCIAWALLDYHQSLRCFLQDKHKLDFLSSAIYFLWNFLLVCPRILSLALFTVLFPSYIFLHFLGVWCTMFLWVSLQGTDFMEDSAFEWLYRAVVAVILYFCWFNVAEGRTRHRSAIYYTFLILDSSLLATWWLWYNTPLSWGSDAHVLHALLAALPCYLLGVLLRGIYYKQFHPRMQVPPLASYDEVDYRVIRRQGAAFHRGLGIGSISPRMYGLSQCFFDGVSKNQGNVGNVWESPATTKPPCGQDVQV